MRPLYSQEDHKRQLDVSEPGNKEDYRTPWRRDYARLIHCPSFRRLQGKTQVFPGHEGDFFRNRLTHSLEVAQIAKSIAIQLNAKSPHFNAIDQKIDLDLVEFAGLAHDLGHPPFGHNGENALDKCMLKFGGFEGNAQTLRIISCLEKKDRLPKNSALYANNRDRRVGLNLTYRSLAAILKYDNPIQKSRATQINNEVSKGYYKEDAELVKRIKRAVLPNTYDGVFKSIECSIMDIADDIAYSTYDLEDVLKSGALSVLDLFDLDSSIYELVAKTINKRLKKQYKDSEIVVDQDTVLQILHAIFQNVFAIEEDDKIFLENRTVNLESKKMYFSIDAQKRSRKLARSGYDRTGLTSSLVQYFLGGIEVIPHNRFPSLHQARLNENTFVMVEVLKNITFEAVISAPALQVVEFRGKEIIAKIFEAIIDPGGDRLLPEDFKEIFQNSDEQGKHRAVCDFIAGMTDRYAIEFYGRLFGAQGITMHKPL